MDATARPRPVGGARHDLASRAGTGGTGCGPRLDGRTEPQMAFMPDLARGTIMDTAGCSRPVGGVRHDLDSRAGNDMRRAPQGRAPHPVHGRQGMNRGAPAC